VQRVRRNGRSVSVHDEERLRRRNGLHRRLVHRASERVQVLERVR
jgi:hypothetical protein